MTRPWLQLPMVVLTVGGGFTGFIATWTLFWNSFTQSVGHSALAAAFLIVYGFVIAAGLIYIQKPHRTLPLLFAFALQIPWVTSPVISYRFSAGFHITAGIVGGRFSGGFQLGSDWQFGVSQPVPWGGGINLVALAAVLLLVVNRPESAPEKPRKGADSDSGVRP